MIALIRTYKLPALLSLFVLMAGFLAAGVTDANAQRRIKFSNTEDVAIAFYKTGEAVPNFDRWVRKREPYSLTPLGQRPKVYEKEMERLQSSYASFTPGHDFLIIRTRVRIQPKEEMGNDGEIKYFLNAEFVEAPEAMYFPYDFLGERIVVMPHKMDLLMKSEITENEYNFISGNLPHSTRNMMIARLKPTEADMSRPHKIDGIDQWVLKAQIASLEIWGIKERLLWEYTAPWYISPNTIRLQELYKEREIVEPDKGIMKALPETEWK